jgi:microcin C transport system permease protein
MTSETILHKRIRKFRHLKRGYYSFVLLLVAYLISLALPLLVSNKPLAVRYNGTYYFPISRFYGAATFGLNAIGEPDYRSLKQQFTQEGRGNWVMMPPYPYSPTEALLDLPGYPPNAPQWPHIFGTDDRGRDVFARLAYGFNVSLTFAVLVTIFSETVGVFVGALLGYYGGKLDILGQRFIEIWSSLPFLYTIIIVSSIVVPIYLP